MIDFLIASVGTFIGLFLIVPLMSAFCRAFGFCRNDSAVFTSYSGKWS
jgi:hydrogenase-4 membrane subunit HyfE